MHGSGPRQAERRTRVLAGALTVCVQVTMLAALFWPRAGTPPAQPSPSEDLTMVRLAELPKPEPPGPPEPKIDLPKSVSRPAPPHLPVPVRMAINVMPPDNSDILSESQLAGAVSAGEGIGGGGGSCDMARAVQQALRRDPLVRRAAEDANRLGKATMLWNGDWVRSGAQEGKGLSAVREAIMWEVAFSPEACRKMRMHGLVLFSLADGGTRFAIGTGDWRWSDLLGVHGVLQDR